MNIKEKLAILADAAKYDASCSSSGSNRKRSGRDALGNTEGMGICHSYTPDGRCVSLLKVLLTNHCLYDCSYCINRVSSPVRRAKFSVEEVVWLTLEFYRRNYIEGLFLSSGVLRSPDETMEEMVEVARRLRIENRFGGYIHLKAVAGTSAALTHKAGLYADRISANIELPTSQDLARLAPAKSHETIEASMGEIKNKIAESREERQKTTRAPLFAPAGQSTQMIVGATASTDTEILGKASQLYSRHGLRRVYYSAFSPIPSSDPRLPLESPPLIREHRLYQADWLIRFYGFQSNEITEGSPEGNLDLNRDPKFAWALKHRGFFPVHVNRAPREALLRVPGLGIRNVDRILRMRRFHAVRMRDLVQMKVPMERARHFISTDEPEGLLARTAIDRLDLEKRIEKRKPFEQLNLFASLDAARTGTGESSEG